MMGAAWVLGGTLLAAAPAPPQDVVRAQAGLDRTPVLVGETVTYELRVEAMGSIDIELPEVGDTLGDVPVEDTAVDPPRSNAGHTLLVARYTLHPGKPGAYVLAPLEVRFRRGAGAPWESVRGDEVFLEVRTAPAPPDAPDIRPLKPLVMVRSPWYWIVRGAAVLLGLGMLALAVWAWRHRRRRDRPIPALPVDPPRQVALAALDELLRADLTDMDSIRRLHFRASEIVRLYVEQRFGLNATDLTTEEITTRLAQQPAVPSAAAPLLREFLYGADRVKFAGAAPTGEDARRLVANGRNVVLAAEPTVPAAPAAPTEANA